MTMQTPTSATSSNISAVTEPDGFSPHPSMKFDQGRADR